MLVGRKPGFRTILTPAPFDAWSAGPTTHWPRRRACICLGERDTWFPGYAILSMFFALSGFLIAGSARRLRLADFLVNRGLRIFPALAGFARPDHACAHPIVARAEPDALPSRDLLYGWGIGINDADNGVFLPRHKDVDVTSLPNATHHGTLHHSLVYCARVHRRLTNLPDEATQELGRRALRSHACRNDSGHLPLQVRYNSNVSLGNQRRRSQRPFNAGRR